MQKFTTCSKSYIPLVKKVSLCYTLFVGSRKQVKILYEPVAVRCKKVFFYSLYRKGKKKPLDLF